MPQNRSDLTYDCNFFAWRGIVNNSIMSKKNYFEIKKNPI